MYYDQWIGNNWEVKSRYDNNYNGSLLSTMVQQDARPGNTWQNVNRISYNYTGFNQFLTVLYENWDSTTLSWKNLSKMDYTYLPNQKLNERIVSVWQGNQWISSSKMSAVYDGSDSLIQENDSYWDATNQIWFNYSRRNYFYNQTGSIYGYDSENWNASTFSFDYTQKITFYKNQNQQIFKQLYQNFNQNTALFENFRADSMVYHASGVQILNLSYDWNASTSSWVENRKSESTLLPNNFLEQTILQVKTNNLWQNDARYRYLYLQTSSEELFAPVTNLYPNPATDRIFLQSDNTTETLSVRITDLSGKTVLMSEFFVSEIDISALTTGFYFIEIQNNKQKQLLKFVKQ